MVSQRVLCRRFVGRVAELEHLAARRRAAGDSHGGAVVIFGEAGIGKSRLVSEYRERFGARATTAAAVCRTFGQRAFEPLATILERLEPKAPNPFGAAAASKEDQLRDILSAFERCAARRTTVLIFEDAHWAQPELLQILGSVAEWAVQHRLLLIVTCREGDVPPSSPAFKALAHLTRFASVLRLEPLRGGELSELIEGALAEMDTDLSTALIGDVRRRCAGNPLFAEELLRHAVDESRGRRTARETTLPISLQGVVRERLDRCTSYDRDLLAAASIFGRRFRIDLLGDIFGLERDAIVAALGRLIELQLVDRCDDPAAYEFRHALTRDVVYGDLIPAEANALHLRIAEALEVSPGASAPAELLAHSFWEAGLRERAAPYCEAAGDAAFGEHAYEDAALWFERAGIAFEAEAAALGRVLKKAANAAVRLGEPKRSEPLYERALAAFVAAGDFQEAVTTLTFLAADRLNDGRGDDAAAASDRAVELAERSGSARLRVHAATRRFGILVNKFDMARAAACLATIDESALDPASRYTFEFYLSKSHFQAVRGLSEERRASVASALESLDRRGAPDFERRYAHGYIAVDAFGLGDMDDARRHAEAGLALARRIRSDEPYMLGVLALVEERAGKLAAAREHFAAIGPVAPLLERHVRSLVAARLALASGDEDAARATLDLAMLAEAERGGVVSMAMQQRTSLAALFDRLGRADEARSFANRALHELARLAVPFGLAWQIATLARLVPERIGELRMQLARGGPAASCPLDAALCKLLDARSAGTDAASESAAREAATLFHEIGWPALEAECLELAHDRAAALELYRRFGYLAHVRRLERDASDADAASSRGTGALSPRERELVALIAQGKNNREAALELSVTVKAVEKYLTSIYQKLGVKSRSQLTVAVGAARSFKR